MIFTNILDLSGIGKMLNNFIVKPLFENLTHNFIEQIIFSTASSLLSGGIASAMGGSPDYTAINNSTQDAVDTLQSQFDYLTKPGGGFEQGEVMMKKVQDDTMNKVFTQYSSQLDKQIEQGNNLIASTGFAGSGIASKKVSDMTNNVISAYNSAAMTQSVKNEKEQQDFNIEKYNTLATMEKEMNQLLGNYASATGQTFSASGGISGLSEYQEGLL